MAKDITVVKVFTIENKKFKITSSEDDPEPTIDAIDAINGPVQALTKSGVATLFKCCATVTKALREACGHPIGYFWFRDVDEFHEAIRNTARVDAHKAAMQLHALEWAAAIDELAEFEADLKACEARRSR